MRCHHRSATQIQLSLIPKRCLRVQYKMTYLNFVIDILTCGCVFRTALLVLLQFYSLTVNRRLRFHEFAPKFRRNTAILNKLVTSASILKASRLIRGLDGLSQSNSRCTRLCGLSMLFAATGSLNWRRILYVACGVTRDSRLSLQSKTFTGLRSHSS